MCGRTSLAVLPEHLRPFLERHGVADAPPWYSPRYNIAPSTDQLVVVERDGQRAALKMRWGLIPFWARDESIGSRMINARAESVATKPAFREAFVRRRGIVVVDSYYEWRTNANGPKTPFRVSRPDAEPFALAALWDRWDGTDSPIESCTIITTVASAPMKLVHERMPVVFETALAEEWLDSATSGEAAERLLQRGSDALVAEEVSRYVNSPSNEGILCWERVTED